MTPTNMWSIWTNSSNKLATSRVNLTKNKIFIPISEMLYQLDETDIRFPPTSHAEPDGLLALGGDLSSERLVEAYTKGIFPWYSEETPILWYSPHQRFVLFPEQIKISKSMRQLLRSQKYVITVDKNFDQVIKNCASRKRKDQDGTWILPEMIDAYNTLHRLGVAHSIEVWNDDELVGGLYGIVISKVFCGESMFSNESNTSKIALIALARDFGLQMIDCQVYSEHLESLGARLIPRNEFEKILYSQQKHKHVLQKVF